jgi:DNA-binding transcriptional MerR regulator
MPRKPAKPKDNTAAIAAQFGLSLKALRLYEQLGMLSPQRTQAGWRVYGPTEIEALHAIVSLKQLGLPLARIAELLRAGPADLTALLAIQEEMIQENRREADHALALIRVARARLHEKGQLSADELAALVRTASKTVIRSTAELEELERRVYSPEQIAKLRAGKTSPEAAANISETWREVRAELDALLPGGDPLSERGLGIARRILGLFQQSHRGDVALWNSGKQFWDQAVADPQTAGQVSISKTDMEFVGKAMAELRRRGEFNP